MTASTAQDLRRGIDFIGVTVVFYCHDGKGKLLLSKRSQKCRDEQGRWDVGGGAMEHGETFEAAVRREIKEEYCADVKNLQFATVKNVIREVNGLTSHWIAILFVAEIDPAQVANGDPEKIDELGWFSLDTLPSPLHSKLLEHLQSVKDRILHPFTGKE